MAPRISSKRFHETFVSSWKSWRKRDRPLGNAVKIVFQEKHTLNLMKVSGSDSILSDNDNNIIILQCITWLHDYNWLHDIWARDTKEKKKRHVGHLFTLSGHAENSQFLVPHEFGASWFIIIKFGKRNRHRYGNPVTNSCMFGLFVRDFLGVFNWIEMSLTCKTGWNIVVDEPCLRANEGGSNFATFTLL